MIFQATCKLGVEALVATELRKLGIEPVSVDSAKIRFEGDYLTMARACLWLRTAERVLLEVGRFEAHTFTELFEGVKALEWKQYLAKDAFIHVVGKSAKSDLFSVKDCQSITKKAIVENLKAAYHTTLLPETGAEILVEVGMFKNEATLCLDPCGAGLSRRGYRTYNVAAPLSETLGAAIVTLTRYKGDYPFIDPMCGSGTMPIEAAMIARNQAPGLNRSFAAENWPFLDKKYFMQARKEAIDSIRDIKLNILGSDIDERSIAICKKHAQKAGVMLNWAVKPLKELKVTEERGVIVCNPPYGERMLKKGEAESIIREMSAVFAPLKGWSKSIITPDQNFEQLYGEKANKRRKLSNGGMPCTLYQYFAERANRDEQY